MIVCASAPCHGDPRDASLSRALGVEIDRIVAQAAEQIAAP
jgi:hypothetical protein